MTPTLPPGPAAPAWRQLVRFTREPLALLEECARRHGDPFTLRVAGYGRFVFLASPEAARDVFRAEPHVLHSGEGNDILAASLGRNSVLVLDGEEHARQRRVLVPPMKGERMRAFFDAMQRAALEEFRTWPTGRALEMVGPMRRVTLRVILQAGLGLAPGPRLEDLEGRVERMLAQGRSRNSLILMKLAPLHLLKGSRWVPFFRQLNELNDALFALIAERRAGAAPAEGANVLDDLLAATHEDGTPPSDQEVRDALVTILIAGHETTALALGWALEQIVPRADVVERITDELRRVSGGAPPGADQLPALEYLDAAIRESLRVRSVVPFVVRLTKRPFVAGGREYPAGVVLCPCSHLVHRRPDLYPEPETFRPERFLERKYAAHEWFPFGGGNRICPGMAFALAEMKIVLATLFATRRLARPEGARSRPVRVGIVLGPDDGARMTVVERR